MYTTRIRAPTNQDSTQAVAIRPSRSGGFSNGRCHKVQLLGERAGTALRQRTVLSSSISSAGRGPGKGGAR